MGVDKIQINLVEPVEAGVPNGYIKIRECLDGLVWLIVLWFIYISAISNKILML